MRFKLMGGKHRSGEQRYQAGEEIVTDIDLVSLFPGKFELLPELEQLTSAKPNIPVPPSVGTGGAQAKKATPPVGLSSEKYGKDVSRDFPTSQIVKLKVYSNGEKFSVVDPDSGLKINKNKLTVPKDVDKFLRARLED